jgi:hypothetical protein
MQEVRGSNPRSSTSQVRAIDSNGISSLVGLSRARMRSSTPNAIGDESAGQKPSSRQPMLPAERLHQLQEGADSHCYWRRSRLIFDTQPSAEARMGAKPLRAAPLQGGGGRIALITVTACLETEQCALLRLCDCCIAARAAERTAESGSLSIGSSHCAASPGRSRPMAVAALARTREEMLPDAVRSAGAVPGSAILPRAAAARARTSSSRCASRWHRPGTEVLSPISPRTHAIDRSWGDGSHGPGQSVPARREDRASACPARWRIRRSGLFRKTWRSAGTARSSAMRIRPVSAAAARAPSQNNSSRAVARWSPRAARRRNSRLAHLGVEIVAGLRATWVTSTSARLDRAVRAEARARA